MTKKINCWEFMKCGRELGGEKTEELGVCPAATSPYADGLNGGINGGRICWAIVGIYSCHIGKASLSQKKVLCSDCAFYKKVLSEESIMELDVKKLRKCSRRR